MEKSSSRPGEDIVVALRRWLKIRGVSYEQLAELWRLSRHAVHRRLHDPRILGQDELDQVLGFIGLAAEQFYGGLGSRFCLDFLLDDLAAQDHNQVRFLQIAVARGRPRRALDFEELDEMAATGLEALCFRDAAEARRQALDILRTPDLEPEVAGEAWSVLGTLERGRGRLSAAAFCFGKALCVDGSARTRARTLQRVAMLLLFDVSDPTLAREATLAAGHFYLRCNDFDGLAKTMVDQGLILAAGSGEFRKAVEVYEKALKMPDRAPETRFRAHHGAAVTYTILGDSDRAREHFDEALALLEGEKPSHRIGLIPRLRSEFALLQGHYPETVDHFRGVSRFYSISTPGRSGPRPRTFESGTDLARKQ